MRPILVLCICAATFVTALLLAKNNELLVNFESPTVRFINQWPAGLAGVMKVVSFFGGLGSVAFWILAAWLIVNARVAIVTAVSAWGAMAAAFIIKHIAGRARPAAILENVHVYAQDGWIGNGFPSGHSAFSAAAATVLFLAMSHKHKAYLILVPFLVGLCRIYLGVHLPLDVLGGWALGVIIGITLYFGLKLAGRLAPNLTSYKRSE